MTNASVIEMMRMILENAGGVRGGKISSDLHELYVAISFDYLW